MNIFTLTSAIILKWIRNVNKRFKTTRISINKMNKLTKVSEICLKKVWVQYSRLYYYHLVLSLKQYILENICRVPTRGGTHMNDSGLVAQTILYVTTLVWIPTTRRLQTLYISSSLQRLCDVLSHYNMTPYLLYGTVYVNYFLYNIGRVLQCC